MCPARTASSDAAARSAEAGSPRFPPNPTYARLTRLGAFSIYPLNEPLTFADALVRVRTIRVGRIRSRSDQGWCHVDPHGTDHCARPLPRRVGDLGGRALPPTAPA